MILRASFWAPRTPRLCHERIERFLCHNPVAADPLSIDATLPTVTPDQGGTDADFLSCLSCAQELHGSSSSTVTSASHRPSRPEAGIGSMNSNGSGPAACPA